MFLIGLVSRLDVSNRNPLQRSASPVVRDKHQSVMPSTRSTQATILQETGNLQRCKVKKEKRLLENTGRPTLEETPAHPCQLESQMGAVRSRPGSHKPGHRKRVRFSSSQVVQPTEYG